MPTSQTRQHLGFIPPKWKADFRRTTLCTLGLIGLVSYQTLLLIATDSFMNRYEKEQGPEKEFGLILDPFERTPAAVSESVPAEIESLQTESGFGPDQEPQPMACVERVLHKCQMYACLKHANGTVTRDKRVMESRDSLFGYPGHFVHRDIDVERKPMTQGGGSRWDAGCAVSEKYKFVYVHVLKSGGSATKEFIRKSLCGEDDADCKRVDKHIVKPVGCSIAVTQYPDFFFFSFARNPFSRMYSMYSMMDGFPKASGKKGPGSVTDEFKFDQFVLKPTERSKHTLMSPSHYIEQTKFLFSSDNCPVFDYLGRLEYYDDDMRTILNHLNATEMIQYMDSNGGRVEPVNTWGSSKKKSKGGDLISAYGSKENVIQKVANDYRRDFELLGYSTRVVPSH